MRAILIINGIDFGPDLRSEGLIQTEITRQGRAVVDLNGTSYRAGIIKRGISAELVEVRDEVWYRLAAALRERPVQVRYIHDRLGEVVKTFYVSGPSAAARTVRGRHTWFSNVSFELEEK